VPSTRLILQHERFNNVQRTWCYNNCGQWFMCINVWRVDKVIVLLGKVLKVFLFSFLPKSSRGKLFVQKKQLKK
jgi:hypothetical protein